MRVNVHYRYTSIHPSIHPSIYPCIHTYIHTYVRAHTSIVRKFFYIAYILVYFFSCRIEYVQMQLYCCQTTFHKFSATIKAFILSWDYLNYCFSICVCVLCYQAQRHYCHHFGVISI
jgi:hypothetical protein